LFVSSRRRHTRFSRDWSSDVCSSDLGLAEVGAWQPGQIVVHTSGRHGAGVLDPARGAGAIPIALHPAMTFTGTSLDLARLEGTRSEERRVGDGSGCGCESRGSADNGL